MLFLVRARCSPITGRVSGSVTRETMCGGVAFFCGERKADLLKSRRRGPATHTSRRDVEPEGPGRTTATALDDEHHRLPGLLSVYPLGLPHLPRPLPER